MARNIGLTPAAQRDLREVRLWFRQPGAGRTAETGFKRIVSAINGLARYPYAHAIKEPPRVRMLVCEGHRILYTLAPDTGITSTAGEVVLIRIFGPGQSDD